MITVRLLLDKNQNVLTQLPVFRQIRPQFRDKLSKIPESRIQVWFWDPFNEL